MLHDNWIHSDELPPPMLDRPSLWDDEISLTVDEEFTVGEQQRPKMKKNKKQKTKKAISEYASKAQKKLRPKFKRKDNFVDIDPASPAGSSVLSAGVVAVAAAPLPPVSRSNMTMILDNTAIKELDRHIKEIDEELDRLNKIKIVKRRRRRHAVNPKDAEKKPDATNLKEAEGGSSTPPKNPNASPESTTHSQAGSGNSSSTQAPNPGQPMLNRNNKRSAMAETPGEEIDEHDPNKIEKKKKR